MKKSILILAALFLISTGMPAFAASNAKGAKKETAKQSTAKKTEKTQKDSKDPVIPHTDNIGNEIPDHGEFPIETAPSSSHHSSHGNTGSSDYDHTQNGTIPSASTGYPDGYDNGCGSSNGHGSSSSSSPDYDHTQNGTIPSASTGYPDGYDNGCGSSSDHGSSSSSSPDDYSSGDPYTGGGSSDYNY